MQKHLTSFGPAVRLTALAALMAGASILSGCAASQIAMSKGELDVQTKMSASIFLDPVSPNEMTIFVQVRNTSDKPQLDMSPEIASAIMAKGYRIVNDPKQAKFYLQANVLQVGKTDPTAIQAQLGHGYGVGGGVGAGVVSGLALASISSGRYGANNNALMTGALIGGVAEFVAGSLVKDVYYSIVTDVQIKERLADGKSADLHSNHLNQQGTSGSEQVSYNDRVDMKTYQTRIVSVANKMNLEFAEAAPALRTGLTRALAGLF